MHLAGWLAQAAFTAWTGGRRHTCIASRGRSPALLPPAMHRCMSPAVWPWLVHASASQPLRHNPCIKSLHQNPCIKTHASNPTHQNPRTKPHAPQPLHQTPRIKPHAPQPTHHNPRIKPHAPQPMHQNPRTKNHASQPMHASAPHPSQVRAMQIIDELEVARRGPYGGGFGLVSFTGACGNGKACGSPWRHGFGRRSRT